MSKQAAVHLNGTRSGYTACGKTVVLMPQARGYFFSHRSPTKTEPRVTPLRTTEDFDEVTCAACMRNHRYESEMRARRQKVLDARRTKTYRVSVTIAVSAAGENDALSQARRIFGGVARHLVTIEEEEGAT